MWRKLGIGLFILFFGAVSTLLLAGFAPKEATSQVLFVGFGLLLYALVQMLDPKMFRRTIPSLGVVTVILLISTLVLGKVSHGAMRWLPIGPFHVQVSEFAKPVFALVLSWYVCAFSLRTQKTLFGFFLVSAAFFLPVFLQPDLGSALVLFSTASVVLFLSVARLRLLVPWIVLFSVLSVLVWNVVLYQYQKDRLLSFVTDEGAAAYNAQQAYITTGSGKIWGRGLGHGVQSQLKFLPEYHTDFFFASFAEELGLVGVAVLICAYIFFFILLLRLKKTTRFAMLATWSFTGALFFQMFVHMGMNMKLLPITGIPLPFFSSGGSSFLATSLGLGILVRLADERQGTVLPSFAKSSDRQIERWIGGYPSKLH